jgi:hypothetical protein
MHNCEPIDIEAALQAHISGLGTPCACLPLPADIQAGLVAVKRTGGTTRAYVQDVSSVSIDCYGETPAQAMGLANSMVRLVRDLDALGGVPVYTSEVTTLPYSNPDPNHRTLARATFGAQIATRSKHE